MVFLLRDAGGRYLCFVPAAIRLVPFSLEGAMIASPLGSHFQSYQGDSSTCTRCTVYGYPTITIGIFCTQLQDARVNSILCNHSTNQANPEPSRLPTD